MTLQKECLCASCLRIDELIKWTGNRQAQTDGRSWTKTGLHGLLIDVRKLTKDELEIYKMRYKGEEEPQ